MAATNIIEAIAAVRHLGSAIRRQPNSTSVWLNIHAACDNR